MGRVEKTVFISYRRTNAPWALTIFQNLTQHGYDVFFDFTGIASGDFETVILENIRGRAHFLVLLAPSALERCGEPGDWLRREIETALESRRNVVPLMLEGFDFSSSSITNQLIGKLAALKHYNALRIPVDYFSEAMERLREKYLNVPLDSVLHPTSSFALQAARAAQDAARAAPAVQEKELTAQQWFEQGFVANNPDEQLRCYTQAILLMPDFALAYYNRGIARGENGDLDGAIQDYSDAIRFKPDFSEAYGNRGVARDKKGDLDGAIQDYSDAIHFKPDFADAYFNRGVVRWDKDDWDGALQDYTETIRLKPYLSLAYYNRGLLHHNKGDLEQALRDYTEAIQLKPDLELAYNSRGAARRAKGDLNGALQDCTEAIRLKPDFAVAYYNRAQVWKMKANYEAAIADFQKALDTGGGVILDNQAEMEESIRDLYELKEKSFRSR
jgi:tetratricopeptide (TPR) repeat protein